MRDAPGRGVAWLLGEKGARDARGGAEEVPADEVARLRQRVAGRREEQRGGLRAGAVDLARPVFVSRKLVVRRARLCEQEQEPLRWAISETRDHRLSERSCEDRNQGSQQGGDRPPRAVAAAPRASGPPVCAVCDRAGRYRGHGWDDGNELDARRGGAEQRVGAGEHRGGEERPGARPRRACPRVWPRRAREAPPSQLASEARRVLQGLSGGGLSGTGSPQGDWAALGADAAHEA